MAVPGQPLLRGVSHQIACFVALGAGIMLIAIAQSGRAILGATIYALSLTVMLGVSASYHRVRWRPMAQQMWKRVDHAMIFVFIAATYTPICLVAIGGAAGAKLLALVWLGAAAGALQALWWSRAPRGLAVALYLGLGWSLFAYLPEAIAALSRTAIGLLVVGGVLYTVGAVVYALRRPDPAPRVFGYHEIFHACVVAAVVCHFVAVTAIIRGGVAT
jgi:hemolysin III